MTVLALCLALLTGVQQAIMHDHVNRIRNRAFTHAAEVLKTGLTEGAGSIEEELDNALADLLRAELHRCATLDLSVNQVLRDDAVLHLLRAELPILRDLVVTVDSFALNIDCSRILGAHLRDGFELQLRLVRLQPLRECFRCFPPCQMTMNRDDAERERT